MDDITKKKYIKIVLYNINVLKIIIIDLENIINLSI